jgi:DNA polymerase alpha subunit A
MLNRPFLNIIAKKNRSARALKPKPPPPSKPSAYRPPVTAANEEALMASLMEGVDSALMPNAVSSPVSNGLRRKRKPSIGDAYDSGSITNPSSEAFEPSSDGVFQTRGSDRDIGMWEMRSTDPIKKARLNVAADSEDTPRNTRKGVSFVDDMDLDSGFDVGDETIVKAQAMDDEDDEEDFLVRSDRVIAARANQSKARDRLMTAIGANKSGEASSKAATAKSRRAMVNGSAISTKLEAEQRARLEAEELAKRIKSDASLQVKVENETNNGSVQKGSWRSLQESLNTGNLNDEESVGTPFTATAAAQKKYIPTLRVDAFEPSEDAKDSEMDTDSDGEHSDSSIKARQDRRSKLTHGKAGDPEAPRRLKFYWLDYLEQDGLVHLLGKTFDKVTERYVSCCVTITGIQRNLFILPRDRRLGEMGYNTRLNQPVC